MSRDWRGSAPILRVLAAATILGALASSAEVPTMPAWLEIAALLTLAAAWWRPAAVLPWVVGIAPFGALAAGVPIRATETLIGAFFAGWLLRLHEPLDRDGRVPQGVRVPAVSFAIIALASWALIVVDRAGRDASSVGRLLLPMLEHFARAGRDPQTEATVLLILMVAICLAVPALSRRNERLPREIAIAVAAGGAVAALISLGTIAFGSGPAGDVEDAVGFIEARSWRHSVHLADVNAAGSHLALAAVAALGLAAGSRRARLIWGAVILAIAPALWLTGSRIAVAGALAGAACAALVAGRRRQIERADPHAARAVAAPAAALAALAIILGVIWMTPDGDEALDRGLQLRTGFSITSARMLSTAPVFGVGVGRYYERSAEFMPALVREAYPRGENAHNYFAQVMVELGLLGGTVFFWWIAALLARMYRVARAGPSPALAAALMGAVGAYLVTCLTGHPLLVPEATVPFWALAGAGLSLNGSADGDV